MVPARSIENAEEVVRRPMTAPAGAVSCSPATNWRPTRRRSIMFSARGAFGRGLAGRGGLGRPWPTSATAQGAREGRGGDHDRRGAGDMGGSGRCWSGRLRAGRSTPRSWSDITSPTGTTTPGSRGRPTDSADWRMHEAMTYFAGQLQLLGRCGRCES
ncbi:MAG: hypothetical protein WKF75_16110 [Singulisphaera sp.]